MAGFLDRRREAKAEQEVDARRTALARQLDEAEEALAYARLEHGQPSVSGVVLKKDEVLYVECAGTALVEPRRLPGHWAGGSKGVSIHIAKGVNYRMGRTKGTFVQGEEVQQPIDVGAFVVTNERALFIGAKRNTEWAWSKLSGFSLEGVGTAFFNVANRQKVSGVRYGAKVENQMDAIIAASIARFTDRAQYDAMIAEMEQDVVAARAALDGTFDSRLHELPDSEGWHPDPLGKYDGRYFDGIQWTKYVGRVEPDGTRVQLEDPI